MAGMGTGFSLKIGEKLEKIVSSRPPAKAYRLEKVDETVKETPLNPTYLGNLPENS
jgi:dipeptidase E